MQENRMRQVAAQMAERYGVDPELFVRLIQKESGFDPSAKGAAGEIGLAQIMAETGRDPGFGVTPIQDRTDTVDNLRFGAEYLGALIKKYGGNYRQALMAYNGGAGNVDAGKPSSAAKSYADSLLGGKTGSLRSPSSGITPAAAEKADKGYEKAIAALFARDDVKAPSVKAPSGRYGRSSRMSPLSGTGIPGLGSIKAYSTPGGIESLYKKP